MTAFTSLCLSPNSITLVTNFESRRAAVEKYTTWEIVATVQRTFPPVADTSDVRLLSSLSMLQFTIERPAELSHSEICLCSQRDVHRICYLENPLRKEGTALTMKRPTNLLKERCADARALPR